MAAALPCSLPSATVPAARRSSPSVPPIAPAGPPQLVDYLAAVPDPRRAQGRRHSLTAILLLVITAQLAGAETRQEIHEWGRNASEAVCRQLGFTRRPPATSTLWEVFQALDWDRLAAQLRHWSLDFLAFVEGQAAAGDRVAPAPLSCDGKAQKGSRRAGCDLSLHLSVFVNSLGITLDLAPVAADAGEVSVAPGLLARLATTALPGRTLVLDAAFTHEPLAEQIVAAGGDYVLPVKGNQRDLQAELVATFGEELPAHWRRDEVETIDTAHGRDEVRRLVVIAPPAGERVPWGRARQFFFVERRRRVRSQRRGYTGEWSRTITYGLTSLEREQADAAALLGLVRGHWGIENRSHWIRDVVLGEDRGRAITRGVVQSLVSLRCIGLTLVHWHRRDTGRRTVASSARRLGQRPEELLALMGVPA